MLRRASAQYEFVTPAAFDMRTRICAVQELAKLLEIAVGCDLLIVSSKPSGETQTTHRLQIRFEPILPSSA